MAPAEQRELLEMINTAKHNLKKNSSNRLSMLPLKIENSERSSNPRSNSHSPDDYSNELFAKHNKDKEVHHQMTEDIRLSYLNQQR